ncbi:DHA2 family efflux MFS transporter permease subunit [Actinoplanes sp. CA-142083]|uniref:DHA2 family efflux MFS transporter permease subunit n=1 Tax=Actinoplanes sp. CA-142083 TaxID=3239903 RepID=UPI003D8F2B82
MRTGLLLALGGLMVVVDTTVTAVAVPAMVAGLGSTLTAVQWVTTAYLLGIVAVIPAAGWLVARFGARRVYVLALLGFTLFSALAGLAPGALSLAVFRALQGLGGGLLNPVGQTIGLRAVPRERRGRLMSLLGLPLIIGPVLGPPLSGWLVDTASWRWIFLINVPIGLPAAALCARLLPHQSPEANPGRLDWAGLALLSAGAVLLVLGCTLTAWPVLVAGLLLAAVALRRRILDLSLLRHHEFRSALMVLAAFGAAYFGALSILPIVVQVVRGDPAAVAGAIAVPSALAVGATVQIATRLVDRVPPRRIVATGVLTALTGVATLLATTATNTGYPAVVAGSVLLGVGSGATLMPAMTVALRDLDGRETPRGATMLALVQQLSAALGVALVATVMTAQLKRPMATLVAEAGPHPDSAWPVAVPYVCCLVLIAFAVAAATRMGQRVRTGASTSWT